MFLSPATYKMLHAPIFTSGPLLGQFMSDWSIRKCIQQFASEIKKFPKFLSCFFLSWVAAKFVDLQISKKTPMPTNENLKP